MWIIENEGDVFQGKRLWLRPGKKFLFGRTISEDGQFAVSDKTISRQHLTVEVHSVGAKECADARSRSVVTVTDLDTKIGTLLNGEQIRGQSVELQNVENKIALGRFKHHFRINWVPVNFSFSFTTKEQNTNPFATLYEQLGPLDIKALPNYERGITSHLVAKKRNTPKGLQALIDGKYIVHYDSFIQAVISVATIATDVSESGIPGKSPLEEDFLANFPDPLEYLPPRGAEPTQRDPSAYAPDERRRSMFEGYTFVFYDKRQFETLLAPITDGRGKALLRAVIPNETTVDDFVGYVKNVAGEKGLGEFEDGSEGKGVVVVRFNPVKGAGSEWFAEFGRDVALRLDHRLIEQNEFLDAILGCDASVLRRPLEVEPSGIESALPPSAASGTCHGTTTVVELPDIANTAGPSIPSKEQPRRGRDRQRVVSRFRGFDDDDEYQGNKMASTERAVIVTSPAVASQSQSMFVSQADVVDKSQDKRTGVDKQARLSKKRHPSPIVEAEEEDIMEQMAPAAAALKKRRLADGTAMVKAPLAQPLEKPSEPRKKVVKPELDVFGLARRHLEEAAASAAAEHESGQLGGMDINEIRNLTIVEDIEVKRSLPRPHSHARADDSDRWDDKWNGRKDFKKFRRRGANAGSRELHRVIVPLEEVKKRDFGIGDEYWLEGGNQRKKRKGKAKESQDGAETQTQSKSQTRSAYRAAKASMKGVIVEEEVEEETPTIGNTYEESDNTPSARRGFQPSAKRTATSKVAQGKEPATATKKRPRPTVMRWEDKEDSEEDSDDGLRFKFRKRN